MKISLGPFLTFYPVLVSYKKYYWPYILTSYKIKRKLFTLRFHNFFLSSDTCSVIKEEKRERERK
jgi:hypothetical protein